MLEGHLPGRTDSLKAIFAFAGPPVARWETGLCGLARAIILAVGNRALSASSAASR